MGVFDNRLLNSLRFNTGITGRSIKKCAPDATLLTRFLSDNND